jgi:hypothetical protein
MGEFPLEAIDLNSGSKILSGSNICSNMLELSLQKSLHYFRELIEQFRGNASFFLRRFSKELPKMFP